MATSRKRKHVIRITWFIPEHSHGHDCVPLLIEQLRYAGVIRVGPHRKTTMNDRPYTEYTFDLLPPAHVRNDQQWALSNAERMRSFGISVIAIREDL